MQKSTAKSAATKQQALEMYLEGLGFRAIGRLLGVSHVTVYRWIRKLGKQLQAMQKTKHTAGNIVEMDELHTFVGLKKTTAGFGLP